MPDGWDKLRGSFHRFALDEQHHVGPIFAFAYSRRQFGGSARNYFFAFAATWFATVALFVILTIWENVAKG